MEILGNLQTKQRCAPRTRFQRARLLGVRSTMNRNRAFIYKGLTFIDFQAHTKFLAENLFDKDSFEIRIDEIDAEFTLSKKTYKTKSTTLTLLVRTSDVGRDAIYMLHDWLSTENYSIKVRRSPKKKYINQIRIIWNVSDSLFATDISSCLKKINHKIGGTDSITLWVGYFYTTKALQELPGKLEVSSFMWNLGNKIGRIAGGIVAKF